MQEGRNVEVCNPFEISHKEVDGKIQIDMDYFEVKRDQCMSRHAIVRSDVPCVIATVKIKSLLC